MAWYCTLISCLDGNNQGEQGGVGHVDMVSWIWGSSARKYYYFLKLMDGSTTGGQDSASENWQRYVGQIYLLYLNMFAKLHSRVQEQPCTFAASMFWYALTWPPDKSQQLGDSAHHTTVAATPAIWHRIMSRAIYILPQRCQDMPKTPNGKRNFCRFAVCASCAVHFLEVISGQSADVPRCLGSGTGDQAKSPSTHRRGGFEIFQ